MRLRHPLLRSVAVAQVMALLAGCASARVPPIGAERPFTMAADERQIWAQAEKEEAKLEKSGKLYDDPLLEEYLARVGDRLLPDEVKEAGGPGLRFAVFRDPTLNAFAMPNGRLYIHTGLLARLENEAQLATILGHELAHVTNRDALRFQRDSRNKMIALNVLAIAASIGVAVAAGKQAEHGNVVGAAVLSQTANAILGLGLQLAALAAINGYGRDLERQADEDGMARFVKAGYDPKQALRVFELLRKDGGDPSRLENFFFGSHPRLDERIETTSSLLRTRYAAEAQGSSRIVDSPEFGLRLRTVVRENAALDIRAGRFNLARAQLDRVLALTPRDPVAHLYYGDLYRIQAQRARALADKDVLVRQAIERYTEAATLDPTYSDPFRQLGFLYYQQGEWERAREAFQTYLRLKPDAPDARRIKEYLVELDR
ncbi:MAG: tetratricopeptide repeat protein [Candidatus Rokubacteria bacterium]|nr:tetratricopeptide repeat protein [Candidatus Rokubacteria bacterium]